MKIFSGLISCSFLLLASFSSLAEIVSSTTCWIFPYEPQKALSIRKIYINNGAKDELEFAYVVSSQDKLPVPIFYVVSKNLTEEDDWGEGFQRTWFAVISGKIIGQYEMNVSTSKADPRMLLTYKKSGEKEEDWYVPIDELPKEEQNENLCPLKPDYRVLREVIPRH